MVPKKYFLDWIVWWFMWVAIKFVCHEIGFTVKLELHAISRLTDLLIKEQNWMEQVQTTAVKERAKC